jgi:hypothetical protein
LGSVLSQLAIEDGVAHFAGTTNLGMATCALGAGLECRGTCTIATLLAANCGHLIFDDLVLMTASVTTFGYGIVPSVSSSVVAAPGSVANFGGGFGSNWIPLMEVGAHAVVTVQRIFQVTNLNLSGTFPLSPPPKICFIVIYFSYFYLYVYFCCRSWHS